MNCSKTLSINIDLPVRASNAGLFVSRGDGTHPTRTIDSHEIIYVTKGTLDIFEEDRAYSLGPGSALLLSPKVRHGGAAPYPPDLSFYWVHFNVNSGSGTDSENHLMEIPKAVVFQNPMRMTELFRSFLDGQESGSHNQLQSSLLITQMLALMDNPGLERSVQNSQLPDQAARYIKINLKEVSGTAEIAKALQCNPDYLGRKFKESHGWTLTEEIHRQRINYAKNLLLKETMNISEIAMNSGFEDPVYFRKIFKRLVHCSPRAYRQEYSRVCVNTEYE